MMENLVKLLSRTIDSDLIRSLLEYYQELKHKFSLGQYEPSQLNCAKFVEVVMRILEYLADGSYTPLGKDVRLNGLTKRLENISKGKLPDSIRIHIPRILRSVYDIRSKRGVAHIAEVNPNLVDATYVVSACDWILAELIRLYVADEPSTAQEVIRSIVEKKVPVIEEFGDDIVILDTTLSVANRAMLVLYRKYPSFVSIYDLWKWTKTSSRNYLSSAMHKLMTDARVYRRGEDYILTIKGIAFVEGILAKKSMDFLTS